jgi:hypothetical protein
MGEKIAKSGHPDCGQADFAFLFIKDVHVIDRSVMIHCENNRNNLKFRVALYRYVCRYFVSVKKAAPFH